MFYSSQLLSPRIKSNFPGNYWFHVSCLLQKFSGTFNTTGTSPQTQIPERRMHTEEKTLHAHLIIPCVIQPQRSIYGLEGGYLTCHCGFKVSSAFG